MPVSVPAFPLSVDKIVQLSFGGLTTETPTNVPIEAQPGESSAAAKAKEQANLAAAKLKDAKAQALENIKETIQQKLNEIEKALSDIGTGATEIVENAPVASVYKAQLSVYTTLDTGMTIISNGIKVLAGTPAAPAATPMTPMAETMSQQISSTHEQLENSYIAVKNSCTAAFARLESGITAITGTCSLLMLTSNPKVSVFLAALTEILSTCELALGKLE